MVYSYPQSAALALLVLMGCAGETPTPEAGGSTPDGVVVLTEAQLRSAGIETAVVESGAIRQEVRVPGSVQSPDTAQVHIGSIVGGRVTSVRVLPGDFVREGQVLAEIHSEELAAAERDLRSARAEGTFHRSALERSEKLLAAGAVALEEVERRRAELEAAEGELVRAALIVEHLSPTPGGEVGVTAPRDGTVFRVQARPGQAVVPGDPLVEMGSTHVLWVTAFVPEHTASTLQRGDAVSIHFTTPPAVVTARVVRLGNFVDPANRSVEMRFELDSIPPGVRPGTFAAVDIASSEEFEGSELPEDTAVRVGDGDVVFVLEGAARFRAVPVSVMPVREGLIAVRGIPAGAEIVTRGAYFLKAAMELRADEGDGGGS